MRIKERTVNETFFITGATGFIGRRLAERLVKSGKRVKCLARATSRREGLTELGVEFVDGSLDDLDSLRRGVDGCDGVFHAAGLTRELRKGDFLAVNSGGTQNVAQACVDRGCPHMVFISSLAGAGIAPKISKGASDGVSAYAPYRLRHESDVPKPISPYGRSKAAAEKALLEFADKLEISALRPPYVFGEGDMLSLALFKMAKHKGVFVSPGYIDYYYSFVYVDDLVSIITAAMERGERLEKDSLTPSKQNSAQCSGKGIYFPACPTPIRFSKFGAVIGGAYDRDKIGVIKIPPMGVLGTGVYGEIVKAIKGRHADLDWNKAVEAVRGPWICSGEKAINELGVSVGSDLEEKIAKTARWYEEKGLV